MSTLGLTIILASVIVAGAFCLLAIGWLVTGKSKIVPGACGKDPNQKRKEGCGTEVSCSLCDKPKDKKDE